MFVRKGPMLSASRVHHQPRPILDYERLQLRRKRKEEARERREREGERERVREEEERGNGGLKGGRSQH